MPPCSVRYASVYMHILTRFKIHIRHEKEGKEMNLKMKNACQPWQVCKLEVLSKLEGTYDG